MSENEDFTPGEQPPPWRPPARLVILIGAGLVLFVFAQQQILDVAARRRPAPPAVQTSGPPIVQWQDKTFRAGDRVRIYKWAGTFKPEDTGYAAQVNAADLQTGTVLRGEKRVDSLHLDIDDNEPIQIVRVRWDAQKWKVNLRNKWVTLPQFEATIHVEHLELAPATTTSP